VDVAAAPRELELAEVDERSLRDFVQSMVRLTDSHADELVG
jgi:hypothetical protein